MWVVVGVVLGETEIFTVLFVCLSDGEISEKITISRKFKERVVQPILKVSPNMYAYQLTCSLRVYRLFENVCKTKANLYGDQH